MSKIKGNLIFILLFLVLIVSACSSGPGGQTDTPNKPNTKEKIEVKEEVIFEENGIVVTTKSFSESGLFGPELKVLIENNSDDTIIIQTRESSVNGAMIETIFSSEVEPGKKANDGITFIKSELDLAMITKIKDIEFKFHVFNSESWDTIIDSTTIKITTNVDESFIQSFDKSGKSIFSNENYDIILKKVDSSDSFWGADIHVFIENNSDKDITIQARNVSINGFMVDPIFSSDIVSGKVAYDTITFLESDLLDNDIETIDEIELSFHIFNLNSWDTIFDTPKINVKLD